MDFKIPSLGETLSKQSVIGNMVDVPASTADAENAIMNSEKTGNTVGQELTVPKDSGVFTPEANSLFADYPELYNIYRENGYSQLANSYVDDVKRKMKTSEDMARLTVISPDKANMLDLFESRRSAAVISRKMNESINKSTDLSFTKDERRHHLREANILNNKLKYMNHYNEDGVFSNVAEFTGMLVGSGLKTQAQNVGLIAAATALTPFTGGAAWIPSIAIIANTTRNYHSSFTGENIRNLLEQNPDANIDNVRSKSSRWGFFQALAEGATDALGIGAAGITKGVGKIAGKRVLSGGVGDAAKDSVRVFIKEFGEAKAIKQFGKKAVGEVFVKPSVRKGLVKTSLGVAKVGTTGTAGELSEEYVQNLIGDSLTDGQRQGTATALEIMKNWGIDIKDWFDGDEITSERNREMLSMLEEGGPTLFALSSFGGVIQNRTDYINRKESNQDSTEEQIENNKLRMEKIVEQNNQFKVFGPLSKKVNKMAFTKKQYIEPAAFKEWVGTIPDTMSEAQAEATMSAIKDILEEKNINIDDLDVRKESIEFDEAEIAEIMTAGVSEFNQKGLNIIRPDSNMDQIIEQSDRYIDEIIRRASDEDVDIITQEYRDKLETVKSPGTSSADKDTIAIMFGLNYKVMKDNLKSAEGLNIEDFIAERGLPTFGELIPSTKEEEVARANFLISKAKQEAGDKFNLKTATKAAKKIIKEERKVRGKFDKENNIIKLAETADPSTFVHEVGHWFDTIIEDAYSRDDLTPESKVIWEKVLKKYGVAPGGTLSAKQFEDLGTQRETYIRTGKAPTALLTEFFEKFKDMFSRIYGALKKSGAKMNPALVEYYDSQFASYEELAIARRNDRLAMPAEINGGTDVKLQEFYAEKAASAKLVEQSTLMLQKKRIAQRLAGKEMKEYIKTEYDKNIEQFSKQNKYIAQDIIRMDKLNRKSLKDNNIEPATINKKFLSEKGTIGFDDQNTTIAEMAELYGYADEDAFMQDVVYQPTIESTSQALAEEAAFARIEREIGSTVDSLPYKSIRNKDRLTLLIANALVYAKELPQNMAGLRILEKSIVEQATSISDNMTASKLANFKNNRNTETKSAYNAIVNYKKGNDGVAGEWFGTTAINHSISMRSKEFAKTKGKMEALVTKLIKAKEGRIKRIGPDNYIFVRELLKNFGAKDNVTYTDKNIETLSKDFISRLDQSSLYDTSVISDNLDFLLTGNDTTINSMNSVDYELLYNVLNNVLNQSIKYTSALSENITTEVKAKDDSSLSHIKSKTIKNKATRRSSKIRKNALRWFTQMEVDMVAFMGETFNKNFLSPLMNNFAVADNQAQVRFGQLADVLKKHKTDKLSKKRNIKLDSMGISLSESELLQASLNAGTDANWRAYLKTIQKIEGATVSDVEVNAGELKGVRFTQEQISELVEAIPQNYWDSSQDILDMFSKDWEQVSSVYKKTTNTPLVMVKGRPFVHNGKTLMKGGYFPISNKKLEAKIDFTDNGKAQKIAQNYIQETFNKARVDDADYAIDISGRNMYMHIKNVEIYKNSAENYQKLGEFFNRNKKIMESQVGGARYDAWVHWFNNLMKQDNVPNELLQLDSFSKFNKLAFKATSALVQPTAILQALGEISPYYLAVGFGQTVGKPTNYTVKNIADISDYMRHRISDPYSAILEIEGANMWNTKTKNIMTLGYLGLTYLDSITASSVHRGAFAKAKGELKYSDAEAKLYADSVVRRTQADASRYSKPEILRGWGRLLYPFMTYFLASRSNILSNMSAGNRIKTAAFAGSFLFLSPLLEGMIRTALKDNEDDEEFIKRAIAEAGRQITTNLGTVAAPVPGVYTGLSNLFNEGLDYKTGVMLSDPITDTISSLDNLYFMSKDLMGFETDKEWNEELEKGLRNLQGSIIPSNELTTKAINLLTKD